MLRTVIILPLLLCGLATGSLFSVPTASPSSLMPTASPEARRPTSSPSSLPSLSPSPPTRSPTQPTSRKPSRMPTTLQPTEFRAPTTQYPTPPTTYAPSYSPTTSLPTRAPTTSLPSSSPTRLPSTWAPSRSPTHSAPSLSPTFSAPTGSPTWSPTRGPMPQLVCSNLNALGSAPNEPSPFGRICTETLDTNFRLEFVLEPGRELEYSSVWMGMNPTVIPTLSDGTAMPLAFPFQNQTKSQFELAHVEFTENCIVYVLATAKMVNSTEVLGSGTVLFNQGAYMFAHPVQCPVRTQAPTRAPTRPTTEVFNVDFQFTGIPAPRALLTALDRAVNRLDSFIVKDYASRICLPANRALCTITLDADFCFDDLLLVVQVVPAASLEEKEAAVGVCLLNANTEQVRGSHVSIPHAETYDEEHIFHLLMLALGFGTRWKDWGLVGEGGGYTGKYALEQYVALGNGSARARIPVAQDWFWAPQAPLGEWEIMTPWTATKPKLLSKVSIAALLDLNFLQVDLQESSPLPQRQDQQRNMRDLQANTMAVTSELTVETVPSIVKPNREADYNAEVQFALENFPAYRTRSPTSKAPTPHGSDSVAPTTSPTSTNGGGLDGGAIAGIVIGVLVFVCLLCLCAYYFCWRLRRDKAAATKKKPELKRADESSKWVEKTDGERTYWINEETGEFSWTPPAGAGISAAASAAADTAAKLPPPSVAAAAASKKKQQSAGEWTEMSDESGNPFWVNDETGEFSWVPPNDRSAKQQQPQRHQELATRADPEIDYDKYLSRQDQTSFYDETMSREERSDSTPMAPPPPIPSNRRSSLNAMGGGMSLVPSASPSPIAARTTTRPQVKYGEHQGETVWKEDYDML